MKKLFEPVRPMYFWLSMSSLLILSSLIILINYKIVINDYAEAAEISSYSNNHKNPKDDIADNYINCDCAKKFVKDYPIVWSGKIIATFAGGEAMGIERYNKDFKYNKFYVHLPDKYLIGEEKDIKVTGKLTGITCAYANTVFGECVGEVTADKITIIK